ncbi:MAG: hypothetical protein COV74_08440 [Candidatus Omnitrophica bacterium CG11_big_fil_rev_8_21_14_0_20_45_26]|uniref:AtpZ/AtpI family protein n=1 Tax=Candidatus Abzuiibacterium crystallinum TaxID=1974748 RepID=A0A2H0LM74_9BACT|nr:MAG: hypothetical protein COV74_08440 [Candidatus Omnitrophica bacterium CG11_big_fil_rev_8_21_14_0_20_45_26]PIW63689.1 MAG: hypothetical protein COW12_09325 [Candidatus Omnitrophica bacterium CG12_big_fil_rev_8_21_14_0_65_45_16]
MTMKNNQSRDENPLHGLRHIGILTSIPMVMVAGLAVGYYAGAWLDRLLGSDPWGKMTVSILGVAAGIKQSIRLIRESAKDNDATD